MCGSVEKSFSFWFPSRVLLGGGLRPWSANAASSPRANGAIKECDTTVFRVEAEIETSYYPHKVSCTRARHRTAKF